MVSNMYSRSDIRKKHISNMYRKYQQALNEFQSAFELNIDYMNDKLERSDRLSKNVQDKYHELCFAYYNYIYAKEMYYD